MKIEKIIFNVLTGLEGFDAERKAKITKVISSQKQFSETESQSYSFISAYLIARKVTSKGYVSPYLQRSSN